MGKKPNPTRSDLTKKAQPTKAQQRDEAYKKYRNYIRSKAFKAVKKAVEERDGGECQVCGRTRQDGVNLTCHHRVYRHLYEGGELEAADCITLCTICHTAIHRAKKNYEHFSMKNPRNNERKEMMNEESKQRQSTGGKEGEK